MRLDHVQATVRKTITVCHSASGLVTTRLSRAVRSRRFNFQQLSGHPPHKSLIFTLALQVERDDESGLFDATVVGLEDSIAATLLACDL